MRSVGRKVVKYVQSSSRARGKEGRKRGEKEMKRRYGDERKREIEREKE